MVVWVLWHINPCWLFNTKFISMQIVLFQTIKFSISTQFNCQKCLFQAIQFSQTVLIQLIQFSISKDFAYTQFSSICTQFNSIWPVDGTLSGATTPGQSEPGSNGNKGVQCTPKHQYYWNLIIRLFSVISRTLVGGVLPLCGEDVGVIYSLSRLGNVKTAFGIK